MANFDNMVAFAVMDILEEAEEQAERPNRQFHRNFDAFEMSDSNFIKMFRFPKIVVLDIIDMVEPYVREATRASAISIKHKVLLALRFFASGSYQLDISSNMYTSLSQSSASRCIQEIVNALNRPQIFNRWIQFPNNLNEMNDVRNEFYQKFQFPGVIGCIDCTHVAIMGPHIRNEIFEEHLYVNRKNYHSINVQLVCDSQMKILSVNALYPGSTHDNFIWNNSNVSEFMQKFHNNGHNSYYLLGDSGYPLRPWLLTPLEEDPEPETPEVLYNQRHKTTRATIERCIGLLKSRFRCLLRHRVLHYAPDVASRIVNACVVLHNICLHHRIPEPDREEGDDGIEL